MPDTYRPKLGFMIVGAQKCGTVALHRFLSRHPEIGMSSRKEVHLFDAPEYSNDWTPEQIDERYLPHFAQRAGARNPGRSHTRSTSFLPRALHPSSSDTTPT